MKNLDLRRWLLPAGIALCITGVILILASVVGILTETTPDPDTQISEEQWISAAYKGDNLPGSDFEVVAKKPIYDLDGTNCFWASKADSLFIACDWDHDGILKNDADVVSPDTIALAPSPSHVIKSGKEGTKLGTVKIGDVKALAIINSDDGTVLKALAAPGSLSEDQKAVATE